MQVTLRQIRYFIAVAETGSVTAAAADVNISQSAITEAVKALQAQLGVSLLERRARGVALTHQGHQFLRHARAIISAVADASLAVTNDPRSAEGHLNLGVTHIVAGYFLADPLARFRRIYPSISYKVFEDGRRYVEHLLINGELDIGAVILSNLDDPEAFETRVLVQSRHRLWLPPHHPLNAQDRIDLADIATEPLIALAADEYRRSSDEIWRAAGLTPTIHMTTASVEAIRSLVATGAGVALLPDMLYRPWSLEGDRLEARAVADPMPTLDVGLIWRRGSPLPEPAKLFRELVLET